MAVPVSSSLEMPVQRRAARKAWGARASAKDLRSAAAAAVAVGGGRWAVGWLQFQGCALPGSTRKRHGPVATRGGTRRPADQYQ